MLTEALSFDVIMASRVIAQVSRLAAIMISATGRVGEDHAVLDSFLRQRATLFRGNLLYRGDTRANKMIG